MDFDLFVIGGGSAGVRCGRIAAGHGARVGVAEERFWGGTCVNIGCVPKKLLVQAGEYGAWAEDGAGFGWSIQKGPHDWNALIAAKDREINRLEGVYRRLMSNTTTFDAHASFIDAHTLDVGGQRVTAEKIVISTGGKPERPPIPGAELGIISDDAFYMPKMPKKVVICGSGFIAVEFAGIFLALGAETHLVYRQPLPLRGFDQDMREGLAEALVAQGVIVHPNSPLVKLEADGERRILTFGNNETIDADLIYFATGRKPNTAGLGLENAGVTTNKDGAVIVDAKMRTAQPNIYAIGDVTDQINLTPVALGQGHALADTLFGNNPRELSLKYIPAAVFSTPPIGTVGLTEDEAAANGPVDVYVSKFTPMRHTLSGRNKRSIMKLVVDQATQKVAGVHMLGEDAPEIVQGIAIAVLMGATKQDFDRTVGIHPTSAEEFVTMRTRTRVSGAAKAAE